ncbi:MAG: nuclear transport factor 2 family protein [Pseudomonadota bacterium]
MDNLQRIETYFDACSTGSVEDVTENFTSDAIIYDTNHEPVRGAENIGRFWSKIQERWQGATWYVNSCLMEADKAAIEWTMTGTTSSGPFTVRGSEHYRFVDGRIDQIRQYWSFDSENLDTSLVGFPYSSDPGQTIDR